MLPTYEISHDRIPELIEQLKGADCVTDFQPEEMLLLCSRPEHPRKKISVYFRVSDDGKEFCYITGVVGKKMKELFSKVDLILSSDSISKDSNR